MDRLLGLLLGTAVGDAIGLPREGLSRRRAARLYPGALRQRLVLGRGMISDDTEHACMTAQALLACRGDPARFARSLAWRLRGWLLGLPVAIGWGTLRALVRACVGFSPATSGVRSAGNGAVMRAPIIGAWIDDRDQLRAFVDASTAITHREPRARAGALAIALAAWHATRSSPVDADLVLADLRAYVDDAELLDRLDRVERALERGDDSARLADQIGLADGVSGYVHDTVPMCLHAWLRAPHDFRAAVTDVVTLGGDTDTTGAIVGALAGASAGAASIPADWLAIADWPRSVTWIRHLATRLETRAGPAPLCWPAIPLRNAAFAVVVVAHALRRAFPPY